MMRRSVFVMIAALTALACSAAPVRAHDLLATFHILADKVEIRAEFDDGTEARQAKVTVSGGDKIIAEGETDKKGVWSLSKPGPGDYRVIVNAGGGHIAEVSFAIGDPAQAKASPPVTGTNHPPDTAAGRGLKIGIGVGVIGLLGLALLVASRQQRNRKPS